MKNSLRWIVVAVGVLGLALLLFFYFRGRAPEKPGESNPPSAAPRTSPDEAGAHATTTVTPASDALIDSLAAALASKDVEKIRDAANAVRKKAIQNPEFLGVLGAAIVEDRQSMQMREVMSLILGTIQGPEAEALLIEALAKVSDIGLQRCVVNAIGSLKESADASCFGGLDNPSVVEHASGLQIMVRTKIADPKTLRALLGLMGTTADAELRTDVVRALRMSLDQESVRSEFLTAMRRNYDGSTTAELGAALGGWAVELPDDRLAERNQIVDLLLEMSNKPEQTRMRFLSEGSLATMPFSQAQIDKTKAAFQASKDFDVKYWALSLLNRQSNKIDPAGRASVKEVCLDTLNRDANGKLRELAAQGLANMAGDATSAGALLKAVQKDPAWNVRDAAAEALGRQANQLDVVAALEKVAAEDENETVRQTAAQSLQKIKSRPPGTGGATD